MNPWNEDTNIAQSRLRDAREPLLPRTMFPDRSVRVPPVVLSPVPCMGLEQGGIRDINDHAWVAPGARRVLGTSVLAIGDGHGTRYDVLTGDRDLLFPSHWRTFDAGTLQSPDWTSPGSRYDRVCLRVCAFVLLASSVTSHTIDFCKSVISCRIPRWLHDTSELCSALDDEVPSSSDRSGG